MLNSSLAGTFARRDKFLLPDYERYGLAQVPFLIRHLLGNDVARPALLDLCPAGTWTRVLIIVVDGLGWDQWIRYSDRYPFLRRMTDRGVVSPITTVFPSTTAAAITTLHTGLPPSAHGLPEWWVWFDELGEPIETLLFRGVSGDDLEARGVRPSILYDGPTLYESLARMGVDCHLVLPELYAFTAYSRQFSRGGRTRAVADLAQQFLHVKALLAQALRPTYVYTHWGGVDKAGHAFGPHSSDHVRSIALLAEGLEAVLGRSSGGHWADETLVILTADHGQVSVDLSKTVYLQDHPEVTHLLAVPPWGSPRDLFLRAKPGEVRAVKEQMERLLAGDAMVMETADALRQGLFGPEAPTEVLRRRVGDLVVLAHGSRGAWYELRPGLRYELPGQHGSLTPEEMVVPFATARLSDLFA